MSTLRAAPAVPPWVTDLDTAAITRFGTGETIGVADDLGATVATITPVWCDGDEALSIDVARPLNVGEARELGERLTGVIDTITGDRR